MISTTIKNTYLTFQRENKKEEIVQLLQEVLNIEDLTDKERCWALWNISDNLAMLRKPQEEFINHKLFEQQLSQMDKQYLYWIVSDGTQHMTLLIGGFETYWNKLYEYACNNSPKTQENAIIRFETHRANVAIPCLIEYEFNQNHSLYALENLRESVIELKNTPTAKFYELTYFTQRIATYNLINRNYTSFLPEAQNCFENMLTYLSYPNENNEMHLIGSWEKLNAPRSKYNQATCAINNYIIQLINAKEYKLALYCNEKIKPYNLKYGRYFDSKINLAQEEVDFQPDK